MTVSAPSVTNWDDIPRTPCEVVHVAWTKEAPSDLIVWWVPDNGHCLARYPLLRRVPSEGVRHSLTQAI